jgi:hypothetical protein
MVTTLFANLPVAMAITTTTGTPYQAGGAYDVTVPHVVLNQIYGGYNASKDVIQLGTDNVASYKDKAQAASHSFIELYNPTSADVDLSGWSVQISTSAYFNSNQPFSTQSGKWAVLPLTGTIKAHSSYLVRGGATGSAAPFVTIAPGDQEWAMPISSKGLSVALMSNATTLTANVDPYDNAVRAPSVAGYVDMLSVSGNDATPDQRVFATEDTATPSGSKQKAIRRMAFTDTDHNATVDDAPYGVSADTQLIAYNTTDAGFIAWARPRTSGDGAWFASAMPPALETTVLSTSTANCLTNTFGADPKTSRSFTWEMPSTFTTGGVEISTSSDLSSATVLASAVTSADAGIANTFRASATGLSAGTRYYYRAHNGAALSPIYSFTTEGANDGSFSFLHVSDTQADVDTYTVPTILDFETFGSALTTVTQTYHPDFLLETGDLIDLSNNEDQWRWYFKRTQSVLGSLALLPAIGNHEQSTAYPAESFREHFTVPNACTDPAVTPGTVYSFDYGNAHFVVLNTENKGAGFTAQKAWADQDMAKTDKKFIIVALHRGMFAGGGTTDTFDAFSSLLDKYKVALVLQGHDHAYIRTKAIENGVVRTDGEGTVHLESGGSSSKQENAPAPTAYMAVTTTPGLPSYSVISVTEHNIDVHTVVVRNPITAPTIVALQSAGTSITPEGSAIDFGIMAAPTGLAASVPTTVDGADGRIAGTTDEMEYKLAAGDSWTSCAASETTGLPAGTYSVRYKAVHDSDTLRVATVNVAPRVPPVTTVSALPLGWSTRHVPFSLTASDAVSPDGIVTSYRLTPGGLTAVSTEGTATAEGTTTVEYWSVDKFGNAETTNTATVRIDTAAPGTTCSVLSGASFISSATVHLDAIDPTPGSGVSTTEWVLSGDSAVATGTGSVVATEMPGAYALSYSSTDIAGNKEATKTVHFSVVGSNGLTLVTGSQVGSPYGAAVTLTGQLFAKQTPQVGSLVVLQSSADGINFSSIALGAVGSSGAVTFRVAPAVKTYYRLAYSAGSASIFSGVMSVTPKVFLSAAVAPTKISHRASFKSYGYLKPRHGAGSYPVKIYVERLVKNQWKSYGFAYAKASNVSSYTKYAATVRLPQSGRWRLRAYAPADAQHAATWASTYTYVTVK